MRYPLVTIIMATYNSESTINFSMRSIRGQDYPQDCIEILVVDGGSTDKTIAIAKEYGAKIYNNSRKLPEAAKIIGLKNANGKYVQIMDSDEAFCDAFILRKRVEVLEHHSDLKCLQGGCTKPLDFKVGICSDYINMVGDPFSCFVYGTYKGNGMPGVIIRNSNGLEQDGCYIGKFEGDVIRPIGDSITMMDRMYLLENFSDNFDNCTTAFIYDEVVKKTGATAFLAGDLNFHYSSSTFKTYLKKIKFRVINNIFDINGSGYSAKAQTSKKLSRRKFLFPLYAVSIFVPIFDSVRMAFIYKSPSFLLHAFLVWYVLVTICIQYVKKILGFKSVNVTYAK